MASDKDSSGSEDASADYDSTTAGYIAKTIAPLYIPAAYNASLLGLIESTKQNFPPGLEGSPLPSVIYEPCRCIEGSRFAYLMQDMFLNAPPELLEGTVLGGAAGALGGALLGSIYGLRKSKTTGGRLKSTASGGLAGGAFGSMMGSWDADMMLYNSAAEYFGEWSGDGLDRFSDSLGYGVDNVAWMALVYPFVLGAFFLALALPVIRAACRNGSQLIGQAESLAAILNEEDIV